MSETEMTVAKETLPTTMANELARELEKINEKIGGGSSNRIKTTGKKFAFPDLPDEKIKDSVPLIVLGWISENLYYGGKEFDQDHPEPPVCWALSESAKELVPSEKPTDRQAEGCGTCPMNEWESGKGKSKACKNTRKLAVLRANSVDPEDQIFFLTVSPTGLKEYDGYVRKLQAKNALPVMVITEVSFDDDKTYPTLRFRAAEPNVNAEIHWARRAEAVTALLVEPDPSDFIKREAPAGRAPTTAKEGGRSAGSRKV